MLEKNNSMEEQNEFLKVITTRQSKGLRIAAIIGLAFMILLGAGIVMISFKDGSAATKDTLAAGDVVKTLKKAGVALSTASDISPADFKMGQVLPKIYHLQEIDGGVLFIYSFASVGDRNESYAQWEEGNRKINQNNASNEIFNMFAPSWNYQEAFAAKNMILVIGVPLNHYEKEDVLKIQKPLLNLGKAVFYNLNGGEKIVYQGEGENWKAKVILYYYNHLWKDDAGSYRYDCYEQKQVVLEYKGDPATIKGNFSYDFDSGRFGGSSDDGFMARLFEERESVLYYGGTPLTHGGIRSSGYVNPEKYVSTVTIKWNGQEESFGLTPGPRESSMK